MKGAALLLAIAGTVGGCSPAGSRAPATPRQVAVRTPQVVVRATATARPTATRIPSTSTPVPLSRPYREFIGNLCTALRHDDANAVIQALPNYQYNAGVRYGYLGDGEGQSGDPTLLRQWLASAHTQCRYYTPDKAGHGLLLTSGWPLPSGSWNLIEMDTFRGQWKINDFTFGKESNLAWAMHAMHPILPYKPT